MARKIISAIIRYSSFIILTLLLLLGASSASVLRIGNPSAPPLHLVPGAPDALLNTKLPAPKVTIHQHPEQGKYIQYMYLTWPKVEGASRYRIYSMVCIPDTTRERMAKCELFRLPDGTTVWLYKYLYYPTFGDPIPDPSYTGDAFSAPVMYDRFFTSPPVLIDSTSTCYYQINDIDEPNRMWHVTAVK